MKTLATTELPEIEWEQEKLMSSDVDERSETWEIIGTGTDQKKYSGIGEYSCGELVVVIDIELKTAY